MNSTSEKVKGKWKTIRNNFIRIMTKMRMKGCGVNDLKFVDYKSKRRFCNLYFLKSQYTPIASNGHVPAKEKMTSGVVPTDASEGNLLSSQHCFKGPYRGREHITLNNNRAETHNLRDDQSDPRDRKPQISDHSFQGPRHENEISSHPNASDIRPREKILQDEKTDPQDGNLRSSQHTSTGHFHEKEQISSNVSTADMRPTEDKKLEDEQANIPPKENNTSKNDQTDPQHANFRSSQHSSNGHVHEKEQIPSHVSTADMRHREKIHLKDGQNDQHHEMLQTSRHNFKGSRHEEVQMSSHVNTEDNPSTEQLSRTGQKDSKDGRIQTSKLSCSGEETKPTERVKRKKTSSDYVLHISDNSIMSHINHLSLGNHEFAFHARKNDHLPEERNDTWHIQIDSVPEELVISQNDHSEKEPKLGDKLPRRNKGTGNEESSTDPKLPLLARLCRQKEQFKTHASSNNVTSKKRKGFWDIQTDKPDGGVETSQHTAATKKLKTNAEVPTTKTCDPRLDFSVDSTSPRLTCLSFRKGNFLSYETNRDISSKEEKTLKPDLTDSVHGGPESSKFGGSGKECKPGDEVPERTTADVCLEFSNSSALTKLQKHQMNSHASRGEITPEKYKNSRSDQTRGEEVESSELSKLDDVPADTDSSVLLPPNEQQTTSSIDWGTTNQVTWRSYETDVGNAPPEIQRPILKVGEEGHKVRDEDTTFFESLIPHIQGLSPERKMLLRMKTLELIYNFIYN
ncbi:hypothetical protein B7P43_G02421 [Cryptotermes secundus]|uniref:BESS domain-containing protein n=1 Tax=Cryptotermes secundus TaxID=105785 RepID=A0A2J7QVD8_9NEOP|nr:hypothetical protein B7P43_G02421 [Cryptotermes secundus]